MLRAYALADLFSANLDSVVEGIFLSTTSGSLIGLSHQIPAHVSKRLAVLGALTWRFHWASIRGGTEPAGRPVSGASTASSASSPGGLTMATTQPNGAAGGVRLGIERTQPLPVLRAVVADGGDGLQELTVQCEDRLCSLEYVKEGLVVGAFSKALLADERRDGLNGSAEASEGASEDGSAPPESGDDGESSASRRRNLGARNAGQERERLARLLALKASAMAEYLREELKDFKMPAGLE